jgi:hypothetical protein
VEGRNTPPPPRPPPAGSPNKRPRHGWELFLHEIDKSKLHQTYHVKKRFFTAVIIVRHLSTANRLDCGANEAKQVKRQVLPYFFRVPIIRKD